MKRHNFAGGVKTHGQSDRWRAPGSIGSATEMSRVPKGKRMAGRHMRYTVYLPPETIGRLKEIAADVGLSQAETARMLRRPSASRSKT